MTPRITPTQKTPKLAIADRRTHANLTETTFNHHTSTKLPPSHVRELVITKVRQMDRKAGGTKGDSDIWRSRRTSGWLNRTDNPIDLFINAPANCFWQDLFDCEKGLLCRSGIAV